MDWNSKSRKLKIFTQTDEISAVFIIVVDEIQPQYLNLKYLVLCSAVDVQALQNTLTVQKKVTKFW